jgi:DeoR/GlpR family transcriptional regulator of sugar metabolism
VIADERRNLIVKHIREKTFVSVEALAKELDVSQMTIRRDLVTLSNSGLVERRYGGAVLKEEKTYSEKNVSNASAKEEIAERAVALINTGDTLFLDAGTTTFQIAKKLLSRKDLTIITNDVEIAYLLKNAKPKLILCGGLMQKETGSLVGDFTSQMLEQINFNIAFVGTSCIDQDYYCSTPSLEKVAIKRAAIRRNCETYLVADSSKFDKSALVRLNPLEDFTAVITDRIFSDDEKNLFSMRGINLICV